jgi:predicted ATPase
MKKIHLEKFGPIHKANIELGDLTVLVGPQAGGKSLFAQLIKALGDAGTIRENQESIEPATKASSQPREHRAGHESIEPATRASSRP